MIINCKNIIKLPDTDKLKLVAGKNGQSRIISWVHYMEDPGYIDWLKGGELILITGILIKDDVKKLLAFIENLYEKDVAGIVINISPYISQVPEEVVKLGNFLDFPIFELAAQVKIIDISQSICKAIFENKSTQGLVERFMLNLVYDKIEWNEKNMKKAISYGYDPSYNYHCVVIHLGDINQSTVKRSEVRSNNEYEYKLLQDVEQIVLNMMSQLDKDTMTLIENNILIVMLPVAEREDENIICENIIETIESKMDNVQVNIGIGPRLKELRDFKDSFDKAKKALVLLNIEKDDNHISNYNQLELYNLFFEIENNLELAKIEMKIIENLIEYDISTNSELVNTLERYIRENCNLVNTAKDLFIHVNTLRYRVKKIEQILECDLRNINDLFKLNLALKIKRFINCIE